MFGADRVLAADVYFNKTQANILAGSKATLLFRSKVGEPYQTKGSLDYQTGGEVFGDMNRWNLLAKARQCCCPDSSGRGL
jgi:hypothetical protein